MTKAYTPTPVFDTLAEVSVLYKAVYESEAPRKILKAWLSSCFSSANIKLAIFAIKDYQVALDFLYSYRGSSQTFGAYRREIERFIQWSWFVREQSILKHKRQDIEAFIEFCIKPPKRWIGLKTVARFKTKEGLRGPNKEWRPFEASLSKKDVKAGNSATKDDYQFSQKAIKALFAILSSFYTFCQQEEISDVNPVALIRQKSRYLQKNSDLTVIRRLSSQQWQMVISIAKRKAKEDVSYERTLFILSCLYSMYLRISELTANERWTPTMSDFTKDAQGHWWFKTIGKGNKLRQIAVSDDMLNALKRYRTNYLELSPLPLMGEATPLIGHSKNSNRAMTDTRVIRRIVQTCFDAAADKLKKTSPEDAENLQIATVHWLRHTGISEDVKHRPREHVRDDAGHSSGAITDKYIDIELTERAKSAKEKILDYNSDALS